MAHKQGRTTLERGDKVLNGRYEILKVIHSAGMSNVYLALDNNLNKQWCLKEIRKSEAGRNQIEYYSLLTEANIMKGLSNPYIPRITTIEEEDDSIFIVMDYVDGVSLKSFVMKNGRVNQDNVVNWTIQIAEAMAYLHNRKKPIFYRDMKPENVMLQSDGNIRLLDFGISIVIKEKGQIIESALGTKGYAAPEQSKKGMVCDLRSDIYAIGKTMYFLLTGINPSQVPKEKLRPVKEIIPDITNGVDIIVNKCIQEDPNKRYQTCEELIYALQNYMSFDEGYIKKQKGKVKACMITGTLSILLILGSFIPLSLYNNAKDERYNELVTIAQQSGKKDDYESVFNEKSLSDVNLYIKYIDTLKIDGIFSKDEEKTLLKYINPNIENFKSDKNYGELAYNIGKLYWFYYEGSTDNEGIITSIKWFLDAKENGYDEDIANVYYELGVFNRDILSSITESEDSGMYIEYWNNLIKIKEYNSGDLLSLQINLSITSCLNSYVYNLKRDGVSYEDISNEVSELKKFIDNYTPNTDVTTEKYNQLVTSFEGLEEKINSIFSQGGTE